jgi:hypothetical protein
MEIVRAGLDTLHVDGDRLPEVKQFGDIVRKLHEELRPFPVLDKINDAVNDIIPTKLSVKGFFSKSPSFWYK